MNPEFQVVTITLNPAIDRTVAIPNFAAGIVNRVESVRSNPGGKGVNVASALADQGHRIAVTGFLGRANAGAFEELFAEKKIADHFVRISGQTRIGIKITDPIRTETTDINFPGPAVAAADLKALRTKIETLDAEWFVIAGSLPPGVETGIYRDMITALRARGRKVMLDASGDALPLALAAQPTAIKPNIHEFEEFVGRELKTPTAVVAAARELIARGIELVVVSMGKDGACFVTANESVVARPPAIEVKKHRRRRRRHGCGNPFRAIAESFSARVRAARHRLFHRQPQPSGKRPQFPPRGRSRDAKRHPHSTQLIQ